MLESLNAEMFAARIRDRFRLLAPDDAIELELLETTVLGAERSADSPRRAPFSVLFRGPMTPALRQRIYSLEHHSMGRFDIFLVPLGPRDNGMVYEAIFT